jgi:hypothetical protein
VRLIDRLNRYLESKKITAYAFEKACGVANGYFGKQSKGKGSVGSDILEKISMQYPDLNLIWLITGKGKMIVFPGKDKDSHEESGVELKEEESVYAARNKLITLLKEQLQLLENTFSGSPPKKSKRKKKNKKNK